MIKRRCSNQNGKHWEAAPAAVSYTHLADVSEVVNACDAGREGELIFRFVYEMAGCKKPMRRLWISSMEEAAMKEGFSRLKNGEAYDALFASALCRAKADWLIGINAMA